MGRPAIVLKRGTRYGRLKVLRRQNMGTTGAYKCRCDCGEAKVVRTTHLTQGRTTSCGCYASEASSERNSTHGMSRHTGAEVTDENRDYVLWQNIKQRTSDLNNPDYGGRGIAMYGPWEKSFVRFKRYLDRKLGPRPSAKHQIDRIDNDGDYEPGNIRWATSKANNNNRRSSRGRNG